MSICYGKSLVGTTGINGDQFYISPDRATLLLADGASGAGSEGKVLMSKHCVRVVKENPFSGSKLTPKAYLNEIITQINNDLIAMSQKRNQYIFGTLMIGIICENIATIAIIGDSSVYKICTNQITKISNPKKTYQNLIEMKLFTAEEIEAHVKKLPEHMWSMFDTFIPTVVPTYELTEFEMSSGEKIMLCSDGINDYISQDEIKKMLQNDALDQSISEMIELAKERSLSESRRYDDLTLVVYRH